MNIVQEKIRIFQFSDRLFDLMLLFISARTAIVIERLFHSKSWHALDPQSFHFYTLIIIFIIWLALIQVFESDMIYCKTPIWDIIKNISFISFIGVTTTITLDFLLKTDLFKRSTILFFGVISFLLLLLKRGGMKYFLSSIWQEGFDPKNILIVGSRKRAERIIHEFGEHKEYGLRIRAILDPETSRIGEAVDGMVVTGDMSNFKEEIRKREIDDVFITSDLRNITNFEELCDYMNIVGINYHLILNEDTFSRLSIPQRVAPSIVSLYGISMISYKTLRPSIFKIHIKEMIERVIILFLFLLYLPIIIPLSVALKLLSDQPMFIKRESIGLNGRKFNYYIFNLQGCPDRINIILKDFKLDWVPIMANVILGDMNLVGPCPMLKSDYSKLPDGYYRRKLSMKPGLTGLWKTIGFNNNEGVKKRVELDLEYIDNWSFMLDMRIILKTFLSILSGART